MKRLTLDEIMPKMRVGYVPAHDPTAIEYGTVSSTNDTYAFVRFDKQVAKFGWDGATSQACKAGDLIAA